MDKNNNNNQKIGYLIKFCVFIGILFSIFVTYYVMIVEKSYSILENPEGPDTSDYFE